MKTILYPFLAVCAFSLAFGGQGNINPSIPMAKSGQVVQVPKITHNAFITIDAKLPDGDILRVHQNDHVQKGTAVLVSLTSTVLPFSTTATKVVWVNKDSSRLNLSGACAYKGAPATWMLGIVSTFNTQKANYSLVPLDRFSLSVTQSGKVVYSVSGILTPLTTTSALMVR